MGSFEGAGFSCWAFFELSSTPFKRKTKYSKNERVIGYLYKKIMNEEI